MAAVIRSISPENSLLAKTVESDWPFKLLMVMPMTPMMIGISFFVGNFSWVIKGARKAIQIGLLFTMIEATMVLERLIPLKIRAEIAPMMLPVTMKRKR